MPPLPGPSGRRTIQEGGDGPVFSCALNPQSDSGTRPSSAEGRKGSVTGLGSHGPASQPSSSLSRASGWGGDASVSLETPVRAWGLACRRNPSRTSSWLSPLPHVACGTDGIRCQSPPSHQASLSPALGGIVGDIGKRGGRKRLGGAGGSRELGQGPGLWGTAISHFFPSPVDRCPPPLLTGPVVVSAALNDEVDKVSQGSGKKWGGEWESRLTCCHRAGLRLVLSSALQPLGPW